MIDGLIVKNCLLTSHFDHHFSSIQVNFVWEYFLLKHAFYLFFWFVKEFDDV